MSPKAVPGWPERQTESWGVFGGEHEFYVIDIGFINKYILFMKNTIVLVVLLLCAFSANSMVGYYCNVADCQYCSGFNICGECQASSILNRYNTPISCITFSCNVTNCVSCLKNDSCETCEEGYQVTSGGECSNGTVQTCNLPNCLSCSNANQCDLCAYGSTLQDNKQCYPNYTIDQTAFPKCLVMLNTYSCNMCFDGYMVSPGGQCVANPKISCKVPYCESCASNDFCQTCQEGFGLYNGTCMELPCNIANCTECDGNSTCLTCDKYYVLYNDNTSCLLPGWGCNVPWCSQCLTTESCSVCESGYFLTKYANQSRMGCQAYQCPQSVKYCKTCGPITNIYLSSLPVACVECNEGWLLVGGYCVADIPVNQISTCDTLVVQNCLSCILNNYCGACKEGYRVVNGRCTVPLCANDNCMECSSDNYCSKCMTGYDPIYGNCKPVSGIMCNITGCSYCAMDNYCSECRTGFSMGMMNNMTTCSATCSVANCYECNNDKCSVCSVGFTLSSTGSQCLSTSASCPNCKEGQCMYNVFNGSSSCMECEDTFYRYNGACYSVNNSNIFGCAMSAPWKPIPICIQCMQGLIPFNGYCITLTCDIQNCVNCPSPGNCIGCMTNYTLSSNGTCTKYQEEGCSVLYCSQCSNSTNMTNYCMECIEGYQAYKGMCVCKYTNCLECTQASSLACNKCPFPLVATGMSPGCSPSSSSFKNNCSGISNCHECFLSYRCALCDQGFLLSSNYKSCTQNPCSKLSNCNLCDEFQVVCYECSAGYTLSGLSSCEAIPANYSCSISGCLVCNQTTAECATCLPFYQRTDKGQCLLYTCTDNCLFCLSASSCTLCQFGFYLTTDMSCLPREADNVDCKNVIPNCAQCVVDEDSQKTMCFFCYFGFQVDPSDSSSCIPQNTTQLSNCAVVLTNVYPEYVPPMCLVCKQGYGLNSHYQCVEFNPQVSGINCTVYNCLSCHQDDTCSFCFNGWNNSLGECQTNKYCSGAGCSLCTEPTFCKTCATRYTLGSDNVCISCNVDNCASCAQADFCADCNATFNIGNGSCSCTDTFIITGYECACAQNFRNFSNQCIECAIEGCDFCEFKNNCSQCIKDYNPVDDVCILCNITNCANCSSADYCIGCENGLTPNGNGDLCIICDVGNCTVCSLNNICETCDSGYDLYLDGSETKCITCNVAGCKTCSANDVCQDCEAGFQKSDQGVCSQCVSPCSTCKTDGTCATCLSPYAEAPNSNGVCFQCTVSNCLQCATNTSKCTKCAQSYQLITQTQTCSYGCPNPTLCTSCTLVDTTFNCDTCVTGYSVVNNVCIKCSDSLCLNCTVDVKTCTECLGGYYLDTTTATCSSCPSFCLTCDLDNNECSTEGGYVAIFTNNTPVLTPCDPGCYECSNKNPSSCIQCYDGYYQENGVCSACNSACKTCSGSLSTQCTSCYVNTFYSSSENTCTFCASNCLTCDSTDPSKCTSCVYGFALVSSTCTSACPSNCLACSSSTICTTCAQGYALTSATSGVCVLCLSSCRQCATGSFATCLECGSGFFLDTTSSTCTGCSTACSTCSSSTTCTACQSGYYLTDDFTCAQNCVFPCATCSTTNPSSCNTCVGGYNLGTSFNCQANTSCNGTCTICPLGFALNLKNCITCSVSFCARCQATAPTTCTSCKDGYYLASSTNCTLCPARCATCSSSERCITCASGYTNKVEASSSILQCVACTSPCATCSGSATQCSTCVSGYFLKGWKCQTSFFFGFSMTLAVQVSVFYTNYQGFLSAIASAASLSSISLLTMNSIVGGSTVAGGNIDTTSTSGSNGATNQYNSISDALSSGGSVAGMQISSSHFTINGGSIVEEDEVNLALILGICIPLGILLIVGIVLIIYCKKKKSSNEIQEIIKDEKAFELSKDYETGKRMEAL